MEANATRLMQLLVSNPENFQKEIQCLADPAVVASVSERCRALGNEAFRQRNLSEALRYYDEAVAAVRFVKERKVAELSSLYSNIAACYIHQKEYQKALEAARNCILIRREWEKGWFRAGQALFGKQEYADSVKAFDECLRLSKEETCQAEIQRWRSRASQFFIKARNIERVTVDYRRFESLVDDDDIQQQEVDAHLSGGSSRCQIEYSSQLTEEQTQNIENVLLGKQRTTTQTKSSFAPIYRSSDFFILEEEENSNSCIFTALSNYFQLTSEVHFPSRLSTLLESDNLERWCRMIEDCAHRVVDASCQWLFLGTGTCIPLISLAKLWFSQECIKSTVVALTLAHASSLIGSFAKEVLQLSSVSVSQVHILEKPISEVQLPQLETDPLSRALSDLPQLANIVVLDPEMFDETLLGRGLVQHVRETREKLCVASPTILPHRVVAYVHLASLNRIGSLQNFDVRPVEQWRWFPTYEKVDLTASLSDHQPLTERVQIFDFLFDGDLNNLNEELPLRRNVETRALPAVMNGSANALILTFDVYASSTCTTPMISTYARRESASHWQAGVLWLNPCVDITTSTTAEIEVGHTSSRLFARVIKPIHSPSFVYRGALARWEVDVLLDKAVNEAWCRAVDDCVERKVSRAIRRIHSTSAQQTDSVKNRFGCVQILSAGTHSGLLPLFAARQVAKVLAPKISLPLPNVKISVLEPTDTSLTLLRTLVKHNGSACHERAVARSLPSTKGIVWLPVIANADANRHQTASEEEKATEYNEQDSRALLADRFVLLSGDLRYLRPPIAVESNVHRLYRNLALHLRPETQPPDGPHLTTRQADVCLMPMIDYGLLGEGIVPLCRFSWRTLLQPDALICPKKARICALLADVSPRCFSRIDAVTAEFYRLCRFPPNEEYVGIQLLPHHVRLSSPFEVERFDFCDPASLDETKTPRTKSLKAQLTVASGEIETRAVTVIYWWDLWLTDSTILSSAPEELISSDTYRSAATKGGKENTQFVAARAWRQAATPLHGSYQARSDQSEDGCLHLSVDIRDTGISFSLNEQPQSGRKSTFLQHWKALANQQQKISNEMSQIFFSNIPARRQALDAALRLAREPPVDSSRFIDPHEAAWFSLAFFM